MEAKYKKLQELIALFKHNESQYKSQSYDEANTRVDFIDKFFELLDWDLRNTQGFAENYREVVREDTVIIKGKPKAPDYSFRIGGMRKFFVEAKKPSVNIKNDIEPAYQLRRYGYTAKLPLSILTDFEEFSIYDTRIKPQANDKASVGRIFYCTYNEYSKHFEFIYNIISKPAILKGSFDKYIEENQNKKGTSEVDKDFLLFIESWRNNFAKNIALRNKNLNIYEINYAVQKIINRIMFLRIAEDRQIEEYNSLKNIALKENTYKNLNEYFIQADDKYNSGLFRREQFFGNIYIDDKVLKPVLTGLYYPDCPYEFSIFSPEILGNIYEQFLARTIRLTPAHQVKIEEKPEVRKAGGVFYTPQNIVDYIVENTLGKVIHNKTPEQIEHITICDPSCGSGSFLIRAYSFLLDYHLQFYTKPENRVYAIKNNCIYQISENNWALAIREKQKILVNNIFGVDIDSGAVEVTELSLLLKLLENENAESAETFFKYSDLQLLPDLSQNIQCGNSLVASNFYNGEQLSLLGEEFERKINVFDWHTQFPHVFEKGGFDIIIGNPPYFNIQTLGPDSPYAHYLKKQYSQVYMDKSDILFYFIAKAIGISKQYVGFIIANSFLLASQAVKLRNYILDSTYIEKIINFEKHMVFKDASINTAIVICNSNGNSKEANVLNLKEQKYQEDTLKSLLNDKSRYFDVQLQKDSNYVLVEKNISEINAKIDNNSTPLGALFTIGLGMITAADKIFEFNEYPSQFPEKFVKKRMSGSMIEKYYIHPVKKYILYTEDYEQFKDLPEVIREYLKHNKKALSTRAENKRSETAKWWSFNFPLHKEIYNHDKIFCPNRAAENKFVIDHHNKYIGLSDLTVIFDTNSGISLRYILALLNSKLLSFRYKSIGKKLGAGLFDFKPKGLSELPIKICDKSTEAHIVELVDRIIESKKAFHSAKIETEKKLQLQRIRILENQIDEAVYSMYDLTQEEIETVISYL